MRLDVTTEADTQMRKAMEIASTQLLNAMKLERGVFDIVDKPEAFATSSLKWSKRKFANQWNGSNYMQDPRRSKAIARLVERDRMANANYVSRDPCPRCGVRGDIGCKHSR